MSDFISKDEGVFLLNYVDNALKDVEIELKLMQRYIDTALLDTCSTDDRTSLGVLFQASLDRIDSISNYAVYDEQRFLPSNLDYDYLNDMFDYSDRWIPFSDPLTSSTDTLFKLDYDITKYAGISKPFKSPDNSAIYFVNCNFTGTSAFSSRDTAAYDTNWKYFQNTADNYVTLFFPSLTVDAIFSCSINNSSPYDSIQQALLGEAGDRYNPFTSNDPYSVNNTSDTLSKIYIWKSLLENNTDGAADFLNSSLDDDLKIQFIGNGTHLNCRGFDRITQYRNYINILKNIVEGVAAPSPIDSSINYNLNQVNNSVAADIRITQQEDSTINITDYIPNFIKLNYPEASEFIQLIEDYLNTMYNGEGSYIINVDGSTTETDPYQQVTYDKDGNVLEYIPMTIPSDQRISILEKIKRIAELSDPELIDFEYLSHFANAMGYKQSGFQTNFNDAFISLALGYTLDDDQLKDISVDARKYLRYFISNLPSYYKIKGTNNCIKVILYSFGLIGEMQSVFSSDYYNNWITARNVWDTDKNQMIENLASLKAKGSQAVPAVTPHFKVLLDLTKSVASVGFDSKMTGAMLRAIEAVRPVATVFDGLNGLFYTNTPVEISVEPPRSIHLANVTSANSVSDYYVTNIADSFKYLPDSTNKYLSYEISDKWSYPYVNSDLSSFSDLPDDGNCMLFKTKYTTVDEERAYGIGREAYDDGYYAFFDTSLFSASTLLVAPNTYTTGFGTQQIVAKFSRINAIPIDDSPSGFIGFNAITSFPTSANDKMTIAIRKYSTYAYEIYLPATSLYAEQVILSDISINTLQSIFLKVKRERISIYASPSHLQFTFYYRLFDYTTGDSGWIQAGSTVIMNSSGNYPRYNSSASFYPILNCNKNYTIGLTGLSFLSTNAP